MSPIEIGIVGVIALFVFMLLGMPIGLSMGLLVFWDSFLLAVLKQPWSGWGLRLSAVRILILFLFYPFLP